PTAGCRIWMHSSSRTPSAPQCSGRRPCSRWAPRAARWARSSASGPGIWRPAPDARANGEWRSGVGAAGKSGSILRGRWRGRAGVSRGRIVRGVGVAGLGLLAGCGPAAYSRGERGADRGDEMVRPGRVTIVVEEYFERRSLSAAGQTVERRYRRSRWEPSEAAERPRRGSEPAGTPGRVAGAAGPAVAGPGLAPAPASRRGRLGGPAPRVR